MTDHNFAAHRVAMMHDSSFESQKPCTLALCFMKIVATLINYIILTQSNLIYNVLIQKGYVLFFVMAVSDLEHASGGEISYQKFDLPIETPCSISLQTTLRPPH